MFIKNIYKLLFLFLFSSISFGQISIISLNADHTIYNMNDSLAFVEFYMSFFRKNLNYKFENDTLKASFETMLELKNNNEVFATQKHKFSNIETDTLKINAYDAFLDIFPIALPFKDFDVTITLTDLNSGSKGEYKMQVNIPAPSKNFSVSNILLSSKVEKTNEKTKYTKNGMDIIPHPGNTFEMYHPMLYYYVELYNLSFDKSKKNSYIVNYFVTNEQGDTVKVGTSKTKSILAPSQAEIGGFNALSLPRGVYFLNVAAHDLESSYSSISRKKFFVHKVRQQKTTEELASKSDIDPTIIGMKIDDVDLEFEKMKFLFLKNEADIYESLDSLKSKQIFLTNFWRSLDKKFKVANGSSRRSYLTQCDIADLKFKRANKPGWKTDRGRIFLKYGEPDEIERYPSTNNTLPYVTWKYYQLAGGSDFIFVDRLGFGTYELIHSTYYKELQNPNWQNEVKVSGMNFGY